VIQAVLFDLDDTLFEQRHWLDGAWRAVSRAASAWGVDADALHRALLDVAAEGSDRGRIVDRAVARVGAGAVPVGPLVDAFRAHRPATLPLLPCAREALAGLRSRVPVGLVTDGDVAVQRAKLAALALDDAFDVVVLSDELGRGFRKPHPAPFLTALDRLGVRAAATVHVGDRPEKDVAGALAAGLRPVRVRTGEYRHLPDRPRPWAGADDVVGAIAGLLGFLQGDCSECPI
jgi:putative hydrolase of the HAD superfamily